MQTVGGVQYAAEHTLTGLVSGGTRPVSLPQRVPMMLCVHSTMYLEQLSNTECPQTHSLSSAGKLGIPEGCPHPCRREERGPSDEGRRQSREEGRGEGVARARQSGESTKGGRPKGDRTQGFGGHLCKKWRMLFVVRNKLGISRGT